MKPMPARSASASSSTGQRGGHQRARCWLCLLQAQVQVPVNQEAKAQGEGRKNHLDTRRSEGDLDPGWWRGSSSFFWDRFSVSPLSQIQRRTLLFLQQASYTRVD